MADSALKPLLPGQPIAGDWYPGSIPLNISVGADTLIDSSFCFKHFYSKRNPGLQVGSHVTLWRTSLAADADAVIEIGDYSYLANAALACSERISIGSYVFVAGGVTIVDSDFHPIDPASRLADTVALSLRGDRKRRPTVESRPVVIEDDVWIGFNATILKGVRIGRGAIIEPGALVSRDVPSGAHVGGNPARALEPAL
jgi:acetyltransferase-like isoleucine patch superfamily enzyme